MAPTTPACQFVPQQMGVWSNRTGVCFFPSGAQRNEAYLRARPFLLEQMRTLLQDGWEQADRTDDSDEVLLHICKQMKKKLIHLILPIAFDHFLDKSKAKLWRTIFENRSIFMASMQKGKDVNHDLYLNSSRPIYNIFYLLQVLAPGMLAIHYKDQLGDTDVKVSRLLPRVGWIQLNSSMLNQEITVGNVKGLLAAAKDQKIAFHEKRKMARPRYTSRHASSSESARPRYTSHHASSSDSEYRIIRGEDIPRHMDAIYGRGDWLFCDKDCGWCGRCLLV